MNRKTTIQPDLAPSQLAKLPYDIVRDHALLGRHVVFAGGMHESISNLQRTDRKGRKEVRHGYSWFPFSNGSEGTDPKSANIVTKLGKRLYSNGPETICFLHYLDPSPLIKGLDKGK